MSEFGRLNIWDLTKQLNAVEDDQLLKQYEQELANEGFKPVFTFGGHHIGSKNLQWIGVQWFKEFWQLATADAIYMYMVTIEGGSWKVDQHSLVGHIDSVEDLQWSANENSVMASCSVEKTIRIWDCRAAPQKGCMLTFDNAHDSDIKVISWNRTDPFIASGGDDGLIHIWDLRQFQTKKPIAKFKNHTDHITTLEWNPKDATVSASGGDNVQIALWNLAVEKDQDQGTEQSENDEEINKLPPQLLFIHQGQKEIKELYWHPQLPGIILSAAHIGFNIFRTISA